MVCLFLGVLLYFIIVFGVQFLDSDIDAISTAVKFEIDEEFAVEYHADKTLKQILKVTILENKVCFKIKTI